MFCVGFAKEQKVQLSVRFLEEKAWEEMDKDDRTRNWNYAKTSLSQKTPIKGYEQISRVRTDARLLAIPLIVSHDAFKQLLAEEFALELDSLRVKYMDITGDIYNIKTEAGLKAALNESIRQRHKCEILCTGRSILVKIREHEAKSQDVNQPDAPLERAIHVSYLTAEGVNDSQRIPGSSPGNGENLEVIGLQERE